jgi:hypothetical protein
VKEYAEKIFQTPAQEIKIEDKKRKLRPSEIATWLRPGRGKLDDRRIKANKALMDKVMVAEATKGINKMKADAARGSDEVSPWIYKIAALKNKA